MSSDMTADTVTPDAVHAVDEKLPAGKPVSYTHLTLPTNSRV